MEGDSPRKKKQEEDQQEVWKWYVSRFFTDINASSPNF